MLCDSCGTLKKPVRKGRTVEHTCPNCDARPSIPDRGPAKGSSRSPPERAAKRSGFQRADQIVEHRPSTGSNPSASSLGDGGLRQGDAPEGAGRFFPFESMRPGQARFVQDVRRALKNNKVLVAQAPTGIGKTAGVLAPALEVAARSRSKVFFLTSKQSQHKVVVDTLRMAQQASGTQLVVSDMISKRAMCPRSESETLGARAFGEFCTKAISKGSCEYYENDEEEVFRRLGRHIHHVEEAVDMCARETICPYKALTEVAQVANVVVLDYNHFFSDLLNATLDRFQTSLDDAILIVDEAHNLPDRIRDHLTWHLSPGLLGEASEEARRQGANPMSNFLGLLADHLDTYQDTAETELTVGDLLDAIDDLLKQAFPLAQPDLHGMLEELETVAEKVLKKEAVSACQEVLEFLERWPERRVMPERKVLRMWDSDYGAISYQILDAKELSGRIFQQVAGAVLMSGTLYPMEMYGTILGVPRERGMYERYNNPFPPENRKVVIDATVSSKMSHRGNDLYHRIGKTIQEVCQATPGNVAAFFPSYSFMEAVHNHLPRVDRTLLVEDRSFDKEQREGLVNRLRRADGGGLLLGVQGGSLSEGYDFVQEGENMLKSVLVVGVPYAAPTLRVKSLQAFFDEAFGKGTGWKYGYLGPAMQRTLQAAGRAVRAGHHRAFVALMDQRFAQGGVRSWLPPDMKPRVSQDVGADCRAFFP